jgi:gliding motility-associated-like protein
VEGTYTVNATDATNCTSSEDTILSTLAALTIDSVITDNLCFGGMLGEATVTIAGGTAPYDILWTDALGNPIQIDPATNGFAAITALTAGVYIVGAQDANGCLIAGPFDVSEPALPLTVTLTPQDLSCFESADGEIEAEQDGVAPFNYELFNAQGTLVASGTSSNPYTFTGLDAVTYTIIVTDDNGCAATDVMIALSEPSEILLTTAQTPVLCNNGSEGSASIVTVTGGSAPYNTSWNDPAAQVGNTATQLAAGSYTATVVDANGCSETADFILTDPPALVITGNYITDTCGQGLGAAVAMVSLGTPPYTYNWGPNGDNGAVYDSLFAGSYGVLVTDANGCTATAVINVSDDLPYPFADFEYWIEGESAFDQEVQFINNSAGTSIYTWRFGDGESSYLSDPRHRYDREGDYLVQLVASNGFCEDTTYQYVNIDPLLRLYAPNSFTPGIDGKNDTFSPVGEGIEEESYDMFIYNRWGELIWQTSNFSKKWNGTDMRSLEPVPVGTYVWMVKFREFADLDRHQYTGWVNVIRE